MEELIAQIKTLCAGMTAEEVQAQIEASSAAVLIPDPAAFAASIVALCEQG